MAATEENGDKSKSGYTYWKRDIKDADILPDNKPQRLRGEEAAKAQADATPSNSVGSSWNAAGTWEEKDMSAPARAELERILSDESFTLLESEGGSRVFPCKATVTGDSQAYNIRGRPRLGFEFKVKVTWKGTFDGQDVSGQFEIAELDSSDLDSIEIRPSGMSSDASKKAGEALKRGARPAVKRAVEELSKAMLGC
mmetsp:Transcript_23747/g.48388  ORF Transcript_23747/g.48388 Transcript_23747/m.48388 type:complete len:197 (+) Transcript_23747:1-591(+)